MATDTASLIKAVGAAYDQLPAKTIDDAFVTLMAVMNEIVQHKEGNKFSLPHLLRKEIEKTLGGSIRTIKSGIDPILALPHNVATFPYLPRTQKRKQIEVSATVAVENADASLAGMMTMDMEVKKQCCR